MKVYRVYYHGWTEHGAHNDPGYPAELPGGNRVFATRDLAQAECDWLNSLVRVPRRDGKPVNFVKEFEVVDDAAYQAILDERAAQVRCDIEARRDRAAEALTAAEEELRR